MTKSLLINPSYSPSYAGTKASIVNPVYPTHWVLLQLQLLLYKENMKWKF